jgi:hypothetical protein
VQRAARHRAAEAERAGAVGDEGEACGLPWIRDEAEVVSVEIEAVHHVGRGEVERHAVAGVHRNHRRGVCKTAGFEMKMPVGRRGERSGRGEERNCEGGGNRRQTVRSDVEYRECLSKGQIRAHAEPREDCSGSRG